MSTADVWRTKAKGDLGRARNHLDALLKEWQADPLREHAAAEVARALREFLTAEKQYLEKPESAIDALEARR